MDGKYQAAVVGNNISGVLGFALRDGGLPFSSSTTQQQGSTNVNTSLSVDPSLNYFAVFVEGRTYTGTTAAGVNYESSKVTGALIGNQPDFSLQTNSTVVTNQVVTVVGSNPVITIDTLPGTTNTLITTNVEITNIGGLAVTNIVISTNIVINQANYITNTNFTPVFLTNFTQAASAFAFTTTPNLLPILNRGLNGGFQASIKSKTGVFTFKGDGELSTPAQTQTVAFATNAQGIVTSGKIETHTIPFQVDGIRVSPLSSSGLPSQGAPN